MMKNVTIATAVPVDIQRTGDESVGRRRSKRERRPNVRVFGPEWRG
jgi:hypothetical protein